MNGPDRTIESVDLGLSTDALGVLFDHVEELVLCCSSNATLRFASRSARAHLGYDPRAVLGRNLLDFVHPQDRRRVNAGLRRWSGRSGAPTGDVIRVRASDGTWKRMRYDAVLGEPIGSLGSLVVTLRPAEGNGPPRPSYRHRMIAEDRLVRLASLFIEFSVDDFDKALHHALDELAALERVTRASVYLSDDSDRVTRRAHWHAQSEPSGVAPLDGARLTDFHMLRELAEGREVHMTTPWSHGIDMARERDMFERSGLRSLVAVPMATDDGFLGFVMLESSVGDLAYDATHANTVRSAAAIFTGALVRHEAEMRLAAQARTDRVTGLGNRWAFDQALENALTDVAVGVSPGFGLALLDLDRFKVVNDSLGHAVGDRLLRDVASRLRSAVDSEMTVARLGGDELLLLADRSANAAESEARVADLVSALAPPFDVGGQAMTVTASVGLVHADDSSVGAGELLRRADVAMYRAKSLGGDILAVDDPTSRARDGSRLWREAELRSAVRGKGIVVYYQGEWDLVSGELLGAEALVRWRHPTEGLLAAGAFVPLAEEVGLIDDLGRVVLDNACHDAAAWSRARGPGRFVLRVNLAAEQLQRVDLPSRVLDLLQVTGLAPESLCLELTESSLLADPTGAASVFGELRERGVGLAIDDFGTGYSSILQLKRLPVTALKIDRSFVTGLPEDDIDRAIVKATVQLADALGATVTAEGVETPEQRDALISLGCNRAQGYLLARPEPAASFATRVLASLD